MVGNYAALDLVDEMVLGELCPGTANAIER